MEESQKINKKNIEDIISLTPMQEGMLFHYLKEPEKNHYFVQLGLSITGEINLDFFRKAWNIVTETNEMLRAVFRWEKLEKPVQIIVKDHDCHLDIHDLSAKENNEKEALIRDIKINDRKNRFDLHNVPFRVTICKIETDKYEVIISNHHILYDGWSTGIILDEFFRVYNALFKGNHAITLPVKPSFKEFIARHLVQEQDKQKIFWGDHLGGLETQTKLPIKRKSITFRPEIPVVETYHLFLEKGIKQKIENFTRKYRVTLATFFYCAWGILLQKYCRTDDVIFGTTVSGRSGSIKGIENLVGLFINTLPLRIKSEVNKNALDLLAKINNILEAREIYENTSLVEIKEHCGWDVSTEFFDSVLVIENYPLDRRLMKRNGEISVDSYHIVETVHYDLTVGITLFDKIELTFTFDRDVFDKDTIARLAGHFLCVMRDIIKNPVQEVPGIEIITEQEKHRILYEFNHTNDDFQGEKTICELLSLQVRGTPDNIAVIGRTNQTGFHAQDGEAYLPGHPGSDQIQLTYRELERKSYFLACHLREKGVDDGFIVGILVESSLEMVIGILGVLHAGGAYLPIDPEYPANRIEFMLKDSNTGILLTMTEEATQATGWEGEQLAIDYIPVDSQSKPRLNPLTGSRQMLPVIKSTSLAYVIYTSGTTGRPKGVMVEHRSLAAYIDAFGREFELCPGDTVIQQASYAFDAFVEELYPILVKGGKLVIPGREVVKDINALCYFIARHYVTIITCSPQLLNELNNMLSGGLTPDGGNLLSSLRIFISGGDRLKGEYIKHLLEIGDIYNTYGPTEATVCATYYRCLATTGLSSDVPIGKPITHYRVYILDRYYNPMPVEVAGELCISGSGLARGYLNNPLLTLKKFVKYKLQYTNYKQNTNHKSQITDKGKGNKKLLWKMTGSGGGTMRFLEKNPPGRRRQEIIYTSGDLAWWLIDGNIEFLGRIDRQVKIRGFRVELGEIESHLLKLQAVKQALVIEKPDGAGDHFLCAYVVPYFPDAIEISQLRQFLQDKLPGFMVPAYFVFLDKIPLTTAGKFDKKALPAPGIISTVKYTEPRDEREKILVRIWAEVLGIDKQAIGIDDNFFEIGGHSLKAIRLKGSLHKEFNIEIPLSVLFKISTVRGLAGYINKTERNLYSEIQLVEKREYYALSSAQQRLFVLQQMDNDNLVYNMPGRLVLEGRMALEKLGTAFRQLISRHESLRTSFHLVNEDPIQRIHDEVEFKVENYVFPGADAAVMSDFIRPFDLGQAPLWRVGLIKIGDGKHILLIDMHHIISDGRSVEILEQDFVSLYASVLQGIESTGMKLQYRDYAGWQNSQKEQEVLRQQGLYWKQQFAGEIPILNLPLDFTRPPVQNFSGSTLRFQLSAEDTGVLKRCASSQGVTLYMVLLSITNIFLAKLSSQEVIVIGTPAAGRQHEDLQGIIGMFVNTLALKNYPAGKKRFNEFLMEIKENTLGAYENRDYPFEYLVESVSAARDTSRNPLFNTMFTLQNLETTSIQLPELEITYDNDESLIPTAKFDLTVTVTELEENLSVIFEYCTKLFKERTIERFIDYFRKTVSAVLENPLVKLAEIEIISETEKQQILFDFNNTQTALPGKTVPCLLEEQVEQSPDALALMHDNNWVTYKELDQRTNRLALLLRESQVKQDVIAAVMVRPSIEMISGILGILKAGGAYLPIDPNYPAERINYMLADSSTNVLITTRNLAEKVGELRNCQDKSKRNIEVIFLDFVEFSKDSPALPLTYFTCFPFSLTYVIYTSGSTGKPKGVPIEHQSLNNFCDWYNRLYRVTSRDRTTKYANIGFDASVCEIFPYLISGASLFILNDDIKADIYRLNEYFESNNITIAFIPTQICQEFTTISNRSLRMLLTGGDKIRHFIKRDYQLVNNYGPTENTIISTSYFLDKNEINIPIGKPISNTRIYILDKHDKLLPVGITGELCISGENLARGYLNRPGLTAEKFLPVPFLTGKNMYKYMYRSGDLARWLPDGNIEFLDRIDHQLKIRGCRIELGEIENLLLKHEKIKEGVVIAKENVSGTGDKHLCAYMVSDNKPSVSELREHLLKELPEYMIPSYFVNLEALPLTPNGKLDNKALPEPGLQPGTRKIAAPRDSIEEKLTAIWSEVLGIEKSTIGIDDNFFELGGHSLKATIVLSKIHKAFCIKITLTDIFKTPTIRGIAAYTRKTAEDQYIPVQSIELKEYYKLSSAQRRLYILQQMDDQGTGYNMPSVWTLKGNVDKMRLENVFRRLIRRHESLRTSFEMIGDEPVQRIHEENYRLNITDYETGVNPNHLSIPGIINNFIRPFDLKQVPLLRVGLIHTDVTGDEYILLLDMHHIISDGMSMGIYAGEFMDLYAGRDLPRLEIQYKDFSGWQDSEKEREKIKKQEQFWLHEFRDEIPVLNLPLDFIRPGLQSFAGSSVDFRLDAPETRGLKKLARQEDATLFMVLLAVFNIFLSKLSSQEDIVIGTPGAGRSHLSVQPIIGMFVNTLALRNYPGGNKTFTLFLRQLKASVLAAFENQDYLFEDLVEQLVIDKDAGRNPLFDTMFSLQNLEITEIRIPGVKLKQYYYVLPISKFDLTLQAVETKEQLFFTFEYCVKLFKKETIKRFIKYFKKIVSAVLENPLVTIAEMEILTGEEKRQVLVDFNNTKADYPKDRVIPQLFAEQVNKFPDHTAVVCEDGEPYESGITTPVILTYRELHGRSDQLASLLREKGVNRDTIVGLMVQRSVEMIVGIMGVLKAGGAYLPIDPGYPPERINYMLQDSSTCILLTGSNLSGNHEGIKFNGEVIDILDKGKSIFAGNKKNVLLISSSYDLAYLIYTSGSTGKPKGILITHRNIVNFVKGITSGIKFQPGNMILALTTISFDIFVLETILPLIKGLAVVIANEHQQNDPGLLNNLIVKNHITMLQLTPSRLKLLMENQDNLVCLKIVNYLMVGGEAFPDNLFKDLKSRYKGKIYNLYGPTETTVWSTLKNLTGSKEINIGSPIANTRVYILNRHNKLQPIGIVGELCIGGDGTARGYLNNWELTMERFIPDPFLESFCVYRTGDLARWLPDGNIEFLGRIDHQLKIRGFRIELTEVENQLLAHDAIEEAVVVAKEDDRGDKYLAAYFVSDEELETPGLREYLLNSLPDYMVPSFFMQIEEIPLTPNGKIDRKSLPQPVIRKSDSYTAPRNRIEERLAEIWGDVLSGGTELEISIGIDDNFFQLGGHSLKAFIMVSKLQKELNVNVPLAEIFKRSTIRKVARYIEGVEDFKYEALKAVEKRDFYPVSSAQKRLFLLQQMDAQGIGYNIPSMWILAGEVYKEKLEDTFKRLLLRHESLRTSFELAADKPVQRIHDKVEFEIEYCHLEKDEGNRTLPDKNFKQFVRPFDLSQAPLLRVGLIPASGNTFQPEKSGNKYFLMVDMHHIISDGTSMGVMINEFMSLYNSEKLPRLRIQYKDFAGWQTGKQVKESITRQKAYWLNLYENGIPVLNLPYDYSRPAVQDFAGSGVDFVLDNEKTKDLQQLAAEEESTLFMVLLSIFYILLAKLGSQEDQEGIVIGTPIAGRTNADIEDIIGMFVNTLAPRNYPAGEKTFVDFLREIKSHTLEAFENQEFPFEDLVEETVENRDAGRNPLFDVMFVFRETDNPAVEIEGLKITPYKSEINVSKFDLTLRAAVKDDNTLSFSLEFCTKLFKTETIERFAGYFKNAVISVLDDPFRTLAEIEIIPEEEKRQILLEFNNLGTLNNTAPAYHEHKTIPELFAGQVNRMPDKISVVGGANTTVLSFSELNELSNRMACLLRKKGVKPGAIVGIITDRSPGIIIGIMAILKAGGAYLPIDPEFPSGRIEYMLKDSNAEILVTKTDVLEQGKNIGSWEGEMIFPDAGNRHDCFAGKVSVTSFGRVNPLNLVYVIYTSGTTGKPKGVLLKHENLVNYVHWFTQKAGLAGADKTILTSSIAFDLGYTSLYPSILNGGELHILTRDEYLEAGRLLDYIRQRGITYLKMTPALFSIMVNCSAFSAGNCKTLRMVAVGGEAINVEDIEKAHSLCPHLQIMNHYGPTEATIGCVATFVDFDRFQEYKRHPVIGTPIHNTSVYILGKDLKMQPVGVPGEMCISGVCLARGYLNRPEFTAGKFIPGVHHSNEFYLSDFYRTGDLARWLADGTIELLGRIDLQIKIRGYRIEMGEIESLLSGHTNIKEAVVTTEKSEDGKENKYLCAYIVFDRPIPESALRDYLLSHLPEYMVPSYFVALSQIPLTPNGKVDRTALPRPEMKATGEDFTAPRNRLEGRLAEIWAEVLDTRKDLMGIDTGFFRLNGDSLQATIMISKIHKEFNVKVPLAEIFKAPTIRATARYIKESTQQRFTPVHAVEEKEYYELSSAQKRLYIIEDLGDLHTTYNLPRVMKITGKLNDGRFREATLALMDVHESLRTSFFMVKGEPVQKVHRKLDLEIEYYGTPDHDEDEEGQAGADGMYCSIDVETRIRNFIRPFNLLHDPLLRVGLIKIEAGQHILMLDMHHIISDGVSMSIIIRDFFRLYKGETLTRPCIQYKDFSNWQNRLFESQEIKIQEEYWLNCMKGEVPALDMPTDFPRPSTQTFAGDQVVFYIDDQLTGKIKEILAADNITISIGLMAVFYILLCQYTGKEDIIIGMPVAGRNHVDIENVIGFFVNTLALRNYPRGEKTFMEFLEEVKLNALEAIENQDYPFDRLVDKLGISRDFSRNPLLDVLFAAENTGSPEFGLTDLLFSSYEFENKISHLDLVIYMIDENERIRMVLEYSTALFKPSTAENLSQRYIEILRQVTENKEVKLGDIGISLVLEEAKSSKSHEDYMGFEF